MNIAAKHFIQMMLCFTGFLLVLGAAPKAYGIVPCCNITGIEQKTGIVTAKENATGRVFTFKVVDAQLLRSLRVGQGVYANYKTKQVSLDGIKACCAIITPPQSPSGAGSAGPTSCPKGSYGPACTACQCSAQGGTCNDGYYGNGLCTCFSGYLGSQCQYSNAGTCNSHGTVSSTGVCTCSVGYSGASCNLKN